MTSRIVRFGTSAVVAGFGSFALLLGSSVGAAPAEPEFVDECPNTMTIGECEGFRVTQSTTSASGNEINTTHENMTREIYNGDDLVYSESWQGHRTAVYTGDDSAQVYVIRGSYELMPAPGYACSGSQTYVYANGETRHDSSSSECS